MKDEALWVIVLDNIKPRKLENEEKHCGVEDNHTGGAGGMNASAFQLKCRIFYLSHKPLF